MDVLTRNRCDLLAMKTLGILLLTLSLAYADERIDCLPERKTVPTYLWRDTCLARGCSFDTTEIVDGIPCYRGTRSTLISVPSSIANNPSYRVDCVPDADEYLQFCQINLSKPSNRTVNRSVCTTRGCTWEEDTKQISPTCYIPSTSGGYSQSGEAEIVSPSTTRYRLKKIAAPKLSMYGADISDLQVDVDVSGTDKMRLTIRDATKPRYQVPVPIQWQSAAPPNNNGRLQFQLTRTSQNQIGFRVLNRQTSSILFDTTYFAHGFIYDDHFLQLITTTPSRNVYGFGENTHGSFRHPLVNSSRYGILARDQWPTGVNENLYGTHPFYMCIESSGQAFGVLIFNSNPQDYKFDAFEQDQAKLTYRTIGGIFDLFFFAGPTPEDVIRQYQSVIGYPYMPPYWALGFQLSRYGYNSLANMRAAMERTVNADIPLDIM
jgi:hypothetical protein